MSGDLALELMAGLVVDDVGTRWGDVAIPWQWADARAFLGDEGPRRLFITRPRGGSKTSDLAAMAVAALVEQLPSVAQGYAFAADKEQAEILLKKMSSFVRHTPGLASVLKVDASKITNTRTGAVMQAMAADPASAWGLAPTVAIVDEIAQWRSTSAAHEVWEAIITAMPKVPGSRLAVLTSAGDPAHWSFKVKQHAERSPVWAVREMPGPAPWMNAHLLAEERGLLSPSAYDRLYRNIWTAPENRGFDIDDLRACLLLDGPQQPRAGVDYVIGLDLGLVKDKTAMVVAHREPVVAEDVPDWDQLRSAPTHRVVVDRVTTLQGKQGAKVSLEEVGDMVRSASRAYNRARVYTDPWQAIDMVQRIRKDGVEIDEFGFTVSSVPKITASLVRIVRDRLLVLPRHPAGLFDEMSRVRLRETAGGVRFDHESGGHDDMVMALAVANHILAADDVGGSLSYLRQLAEVQTTCGCGHVSAIGSWWCSSCGAALSTPRFAA